MPTITFGHEKEIIPQESLVALAYLVERYGGQCGYSANASLIGVFTSELEAAEFLIEFHRRVGTKLN